MSNGIDAKCYVAIPSSSAVGSGGSSVQLYESDRKNKQLACLRANNAHQYTTHTKSLTVQNLKIHCTCHLLLAQTANKVHLD